MRKVPSKCKNCAYFVYNQYCCKDYNRIKRRYGYCDLTEYKCKVLDGKICTDNTNSLWARLKVKWILR